MKLRHLFFAALATGLFAACNNDDIVVDNPQGETEAEAFIALKVALPSSTTPGTRAGQGDPNDQFHDGTAAEWEVKNLTVYVLDGKELTSKVLYSYDANSITWSTNGSANITVSSPNFNVDGVNKDNYETSLYILVVANHNGQLPTITNGTTEYKDINAVFTGKSRDNFKGTDKGFFMSNAPIVVGGSVQDLVPCKAYQTKALAVADPATVYLERILGKVQVISGLNASNTWTYTVPVGTDMTEEDQVTFTAWGLDVTNKKTFPIRQVNSDWIGYASGGLGTAIAVGSATPGDNSYPNNRFIGAATDPQRIYWAIDPNYTVAPVEGDFTKLTGTPTLTALAASSADNNIDYCLENTFDVANQKQDRTTRIVMKGIYTFKGQTTGDFYRSSKGVIYKSKAVLMAEMTKYLGITGGEVKDFVKEDGVSGKAITKVKYQIGETTPVELEGAAIKPITDIIGTLDYYAGGVCYYIARIKHFGDNLTPWNGSDVYTTNNDTNNKNYLGRYGVVRNNWYEIKITKADKGPGEPEIPDTPDNPDDELNYYLDAQIHILSWAKRTQDVEW